jgi:hypothetical protein
VVGRQRQISRQVKGSRKQAQLAETRLKAGVLASRHQGTAAKTLREMVDVYLEWREQNGKPIGPRTIQGHRALAEARIKPGPRQAAASPRRSSRAGSLLHPARQGRQPGASQGRPCRGVGSATFTRSSPVPCCAVAPPARCWAIGSWRPPPGDLLARRHLRPRPPARPARRAAPCQGVGGLGGPGDEPMTVDLDSTVCQVHGDPRQDAAYGHTHTLGYHPLVASRADSGQELPREADRWDIRLLTPASLGPRGRRLRLLAPATAASPAAAARCPGRSPPRADPRRSAPRRSPR